MANKYSKLSIPEDKIPEWIGLWCENNLDGSCDISREDTSGRLQFDIKNDGKDIKLHFIKCNGGLLTIFPNVGRYQDISCQIADYILSRSKNPIKDSPFANGFSIIIGKDDFDTIIELLNEGDNSQCINESTQLEAGKQQYYMYKYKGLEGDSVAIKFFPSTSRMFLQGKPLFLFNEIVGMVADVGIDKSDVLDAQIQYCNVPVEKNEIIEEMKSVLGEKLYSYLSLTQIAILSSSFVFARIDVELGDYSCLVVPALRAYEGFMKKILLEFGFDCGGKDQPGKFFTCDETGVRYELSDKTGNEQEEQLLSRMYSFYRSKRHPYSHAAANDFYTSIIEEREVANDLFHEIISMIKSVYEGYKVIKG